MFSNSDSLFINKNEASLSEESPNNKNEPVSTKSIDTWTNHALLEYLIGIILKKFTSIKVAIKVLPISIKNFFTIAKERNNILSFSY